MCVALETVNRATMPSEIPNFSTGSQGYLSDGSH